MWMWSDSPKSPWQCSSVAALKMRIFNADFLMIIPELDLKEKKSCQYCRTRALFMFYVFEQCFEMRNILMLQGIPFVESVLLPF